MYVWTPYPDHLGALQKRFLVMLRAGAALLLFHSAHVTHGDVKCGVQGSKQVTVANGTKCFYLTGWAYTFDECATERCPASGGHLASVVSQEEFDAVFDAFKGDWGKGCAFVGLHRCNTRETWRWTTGDADTDVAWADGEPNDWAGSEDCAMVCNNAGGLNDGPCHDTIRCLCDERCAFESISRAFPATNES